MAFEEDYKCRLVSETLNVVQEEFMWFIRYLK